MRIGVLADTHIPSNRDALPQVIHDLFAGVAMILHAGDVVSENVITELQAIAPTYAVRGNMDYAFQAPAKRILEVEGKRTGLIHIPPAPLTEEGIRSLVGDVDCLVHGHTHKPRIERVGSVLVFNPGAVTAGPWYHQNSVGILEVGRKITAQVIPLP
jgi:hypothetical protein